MKVFDKIAVAQINLTVGDFAGNVARILAAADDAKAGGAELVVFHELAIANYIAEDLFLRGHFVAQEQAALREIAEKISLRAVIGALQVQGDKLFNAAYLLEEGMAKLISTKKDLPNSGVFDEHRYFASGDVLELFEVAGKKAAVVVCEDGWTAGRSLEAKAAGAEIIISINASPYEYSKIRKRHRVFAATAQEVELPILYAHGVGAQDEVVFDGGSFLLNASGELVANLPEFEEVVSPLTKLHEILPLEESKYRATVLGLHDYMRKNGFEKVLLGLSGGIDSALVTAIAVDALGAENVRCVMLPSKFTSQESLDDSAELAKNLGVRYETISIEPAVAAYGEMLVQNFEDTETGLAEENLQSRVRGVTLMAISNKHGELLLTTGNKSELAVGYATLYGDMCGAFNPIKDLYKTEVFAVSRWCGKISENILSKEPTAELRENQKDSDSLPPYDVLDGILLQLVEGHKSAADVEGYDPALVLKIARLLKTSEFKRKQSPMGVKLSSCAFGKDWRLQVSSKY